MIAVAPRAGKPAAGATRPGADRVQSRVMPVCPPQPESRPPETPAPATAYLALGSNVGDRDEHLRRALAAVAALPGISSVVPSAFYETAPVGPQDQGPFLNAAARIDTTLAPEPLLEQLLGLERKLGRPPREARQHWGPREIDLDLLLHGDTVLDLPGLTLPHPRLHERWFVLRPMCDVGPDVPHPLFRQTMRQLLHDLEAQEQDPDQNQAHHEVEAAP